MSNTDSEYTRTICDPRSLVNQAKKTQEANAKTFESWKQEAEHDDRIWASLVDNATLSANALCDYFNSNSGSDFYVRTRIKDKQYKYDPIGTGYSKNKYGITFAAPCLTLDILRSSNSLGPTDTLKGIFQDRVSFDSGFKPRIAQIEVFKTHNRYHSGPYNNFGLGERGHKAAMDYIALRMLDNLTQQESQLLAQNENGIVTPETIKLECLQQ